MSKQKESPSAGEPRGIPENNLTNNPIISPDADMRQRIAGCFVAVVQVRSEAAEPRYSRRVFLSLQPAQRAAENARARGLHAAVFVAELQPVGVIGDE